MMRCTVMLAAMMAIVPAAVHAQDRAVSGVVKGKYSVPLPFKGKWASCPADFTITKMNDDRSFVGSATLTGEGKWKNGKIDFTGRLKGDLSMELTRTDKVDAKGFLDKTGGGTTIAQKCTAGAPTLVADTDYVWKGTTTGANLLANEMGFEATLPREWISPIQQVGFRAFVLKKAAIELNLAGWAKNMPDGTVQFAFQGDAKRIDQAIQTIKQGHNESQGHVAEVTQTAAKFDPKLKTFTVLGWTSHSRMITTPYDLVFVLRTNGSVSDKQEARMAFNRILRDTLSPADFAKLRPEDLK